MIQVNNRELYFDLITDSYKKKVQALLGLCQSPIEEYILLDFIHYFGKNSLSLFILDFVFEDYVDNPCIDKDVINYGREVDGIFESGPFTIYGIKVKDIYMGLEFILTPQYIIETRKQKYIVDFVIIGTIENEKMKSNKQNFQFFIECDGHEYHHTKDQRKYDNERTRVLKSMDWEELRYSGSEINSGEISLAKDFFALIKRKYFQSIR